MREGEITIEKYHRAIGLFCQDVVTETIQVETVEDEDKAEAAALLEKYGLRTNLRTLDSLQLAVMKKVPKTQLDQVLCADRVFCSLIREEGLVVRNPEEDPFPS